MNDNLGKVWDVIAITSENKSSSSVFLEELENRQKEGFIHKDTFIFCIEDPKSNVGSGGATINAILVIAEHLSSYSGFTVVTLEVLRNARILLLHAGQSYVFSTLHRGFLPLTDNKLSAGGFLNGNHIVSTHVDNLISTISTVLAKDAPPGMWIGSTDMNISISKDTVINWEDRSAGAVAFMVLENVERAADHVVCNVSDEGFVKDIVHFPSLSIMQSFCKEPNRVPMMTGIVYCSPVVVETLLSMHTVSPLDACTYWAVDSNARVIKNLSLYYDILLAMSAGKEEKDYICREQECPFQSDVVISHSHEDAARKKEARAIIWKHLSGFRLRAEIIKDAKWSYILSKSARDLYLEYHNLPSTYFWQEHNTAQSGTSTLVNTIVEGSQLGANSVCINSHIKSNGVHLDDELLFMNIDENDFMTVPAGMKIKGQLAFFGRDITIESLSCHILIAVGLDDNLMAPMSDKCSKFCNQSWDEFFRRTGISSTEIWSPELHPSSFSVLNAKVFPVLHPYHNMHVLDLLWLVGAIEGPQYLKRWRESWRLSLEDIHLLSNINSEFSAIRKINFKLASLMIVHVLTNEEQVPFFGQCLLPLFRTCVFKGYFEKLLELLDFIKYTRNNAARVFSCVADVLGIKIKLWNGVRSGPANNLCWRPAFEALESGDLVLGCKLLSEERKHWLGRDDLLTRAARHYERASQIMVSLAVKTGLQFGFLTTVDLPPIGECVVAEAPARIDISGTWSDTPPICYDMGGAVLTIAVKVDGKKPIGCKVCRVKSPVIIIVLGDDGQKIVCEEFTDLMDYAQPNTPGALIKAAFVCVELVDPSSHLSLSKQLASRYEGGIEVQCWSNLPHGSGLGTSSILAGCVLAALLRSTGRIADLQYICQRVLHLEQMLTTAGGWQDQVGGLYPGIKVGFCHQGLPLQVFHRPVDMPEGFLDVVEKHIVLVFTGQTRLARNVLQNVLRNWNSRQLDITQTVLSIKEDAVRCEEAFKKGDLEGIGKCLNSCWKNKKKIAIGCEPTVCRLIMEAIKDLVYGEELTGAGGGGFMCLLTKEPNATAAVQDRLDKLMTQLRKDNAVLQMASVHEVLIDRDGLTLTLR